MQYALPPILNPKTYTSPSGEYTLHVNPSDRHGEGGADYRLSRKGAIVWEGKHPFTLWDAGVTDDGSVGGYAYSFGPEGWGGKTPGDIGYFEVVILDPAGKARLHQKVKRKNSLFLHSPPDPIARGLIVDGGNDRLIVRVLDEDHNRGEEMWWGYQLSTGQRQPHFSPKRIMGGGPEAPARYIIDAKAVAGTPLTLIHWWRFGEGDTYLGARFTLIDPKGKPVWSLELPRDYTISGSEEAQDRLMNEMQRTSAIQRTDEPGRFTLRFVADSQRVTFAVTSGEEGKWTVAEVGREPYVPVTKPVRFSAPEVRLKLRDRIELSDPGPQTKHPIRRVFDLVAAGPGRLAFLRREDKTDLVMVNESGQILHTVSLDSIPRKKDDTFSGLLWREGTRFLVFVERRSENPDEAYKIATEAYQVDARTASITKLAGFRCFWLRSVAAFPDGGFVLLTTEHQKYTMQDGVCAYDARGRLLWALREDGYTPNQPPGTLFSPESLTVLRDGTVAVLDNIQKTVQIYDRRSKYLRTISLTKAWKREPNYPTDILADPKGGFMVHDFGGKPSLVWMNAGGGVLKTSTPFYTNGKQIENPDICLSPDGSLWLSDSYSMLRMDEKGRVAKRLGEAPRPDRLQEIVEVAIYPNGRILAADERTNAVHIFDARGRWQAVCKPKKAAQETPSDFRSLHKEIELGPNGTFALDEEWFGTQGKAQGKPIGLRTHRERLRGISRRPDRTWLEDIEAVAVAPNGAMAVLDGPNRLSREGEQYRLSLYSATDVPERTVLLPDKLGVFPQLAYDGKRVIVTGETGIYGFRATGEALWHFPLPPDKPDEYVWRPFLTDDGTTLCLFNGQRTIYRYALP